MKAVSLFSGIGGFELAMQRCGIEVIATCEIDKKARKLLEARFPLTKHYDDVKSLTGAQIEKDGFDGTDGIITAGFPCQDLSIAGLRKGLAGERSGLFHEIIRLTDEVQPQFLILENVVGLLSSQSGKDMGIVITSLVERGYGVCWRVLDSQNFGVPQRRRRVFIVASFGDHRGPVEILFEPESLSGYFEPSRKKRKKTSGGIKESINQTSESIDVSKPQILRMRSGKDGGGKGALISEDKSLTIATANDQTLFLFEATRVGDPRFHAVRRLTPIECERLQGFPDGWTEGQADSTRYKQLGNAVTVPVVEWIMKRVVKISMATEATNSGSINQTSKPPSEGV